MIKKIGVLIVIFFVVFIWIGAPRIEAQCVGSCTTCDMVWDRYVCNNGNSCSGPGADDECPIGMTCNFLEQVCDGPDVCACDSITSDCGCSGGCKPGQLIFSDNCSCTCTYPSNWSDVAYPSCGGYTQYKDPSNDCGGTCSTLYQGCNECETCSDKCGQEKDCGGNCSSSDDYVSYGTCSNNCGSGNSRTASNPCSDPSSWTDYTCPCVECETCSLRCGQAKVCGGNCSSSDDYVSYGTCSNNCGSGNSRTASNPCSDPSSWTDYTCPCVECETCNLKCGQTKNCGGLCPIDETLTNCSSTISTQYVETPQTTGSIWARAVGCSAGITNFQFPTWNSYNSQDDIVWYNAANQGGGVWQASINVASHQPLLGNPINVHAYSWGCNHDSNNKKLIGTTSFLVTPKTCSVVVTRTGNQTFSVTVSGDGSLNPGIQTGRLWVERQDTSQVANYATEIIPATVEHHVAGNPYYYNFTSANLSSTNSAVDSKTINVTLPGGNYYFHCDMPEDIGTNFVKCSGNPFCSYEGLGGGLTCTNWKSCSNNDRAAVCSEAETCALKCNQAKDCSGSCTGEDAGVPDVPVINYPAGTSLNPTILSSGITGVTLSLAGPANLADSYFYGVYDDGASFTWVGSTATSVGITGLLPGNLYSWRARSVNDTCVPIVGGVGITSVASNFGYFRINSPPVIGALGIYNNSGVAIPAEAGSRNHICQSEFNGSRLVNFRLNVGDSDGVNDIAEVTLNWNGNTYVLGRGATWSTGATFSTTINYGTYDDPGVYEITATAVDVSHQSTSGGTGRNWKVWNCEVPTNGHIYDGSADHSCAGGFSNLADLDMDFRALEFNNASGSVTATVTVPNAFGTDNLIWDRNYLPLINGGLSPNPDGDLAATGRLTRLIGPGVPVGCLPNNMVNTGNIDAYSPAPSAQVDFSYIRDQESWYQIRGGGIRAGDSIQSGVPVTANPLERYLTLGKSLPTTINNGLVSYAINFSNTNGYNDEAYGSPNSWWKNSSLLPATRYGYQYFYNNLFVKAGVGVTGKTWDEKPSEGVYFVNGNLTIDSNFVLPADRFFMVVVSGSITITNGVTQIDGIYVSDGEISATGNSANALEINGMLYSKDNVKLARSFVDKTLNNTIPATVVNYRPSLLFNMPIKISKIISGWRED